MRMWTRTHIFTLHKAKFSVLWYKRVNIFIFIFLKAYYGGHVQGLQNPPCKARITYQSFPLWYIKLMVVDAPMSLHMILHCNNISFLRIQNICVFWEQARPKKIPPHRAVLISSMRIIIQNGSEIWGRTSSQNYGFIVHFYSLMFLKLCSFYGDLTALL